MRSLIGYWLASKEYTDREDVPRNEEPENVEGAVQIRYDILERNKEVYTNATTSKKYSFIIECSFKDTIDVHDLIYVQNEWYEVERVNEKLPKEKQAIVKAWPGLYERHAVKVVYLE